MTHRLATGMDGSLPGGRPVLGPSGSVGRASGADGPVLADEVYWLVHDDVTGRVRTAGRSAGVMLAAAVLAELIAAGDACLVDGRVVAFVPVLAGDDGLRAGVLAQVIAEDERYTVRQWLELLSEDMRERVAERMVAAGRACRRAGLWRREVVANPGDEGPAWMRVGLIEAVRRGDVLGAPQLFLLGLARYSGMAEHPLADLDPGYVRHALAQLSALPDGWRQLVAAATDLIRAAAITR